MYGLFDYNFANMVIQMIGKRQAEEEAHLAELPPELRRSWLMARVRGLFPETKDVNTSMHCEEPLLDSSGCE